MMAMSVAPILPHSRAGRRPVSYAGGLNRASSAIAPGGEGGRPRPRRWITLRGIVSGAVTALRHLRPSSVGDAGLVAMLEHERRHRHTQILGVGSPSRRGRGSWQWRVSIGTMLALK